MPKSKGEILGVVIVESGWGSMLPTVVIANLAPAGAAARCGQLNIGDQIIAINGVSLVGLPLSTCQNYIKVLMNLFITLPFNLILINCFSLLFLKNSKPQTVIKLTVVPCAPVVEVKIKRPDTKYQLGFSVQNGVVSNKSYLSYYFNLIFIKIFSLLYFILYYRYVAYFVVELQNVVEYELDIELLK